MAAARGRVARPKQSIRSVGATHWVG